MSTRILVICAFIVLASANDIILLNENTGNQVLDAKYEASPAIWRQEKNVTFRATNGEVISKIIVTDLRPEKDGTASIAAGGIGQDNVVIELQSPSILRGFDYRVQIFTTAPKASTTTASTLLSSFFASRVVTIGLEASIDDAQQPRAQLENKNVLRTDSSQNNMGQTEKPDEKTPDAPEDSSKISDLTLVIDKEELNKRNKHVTQREDLKITTPMPRSARHSGIQNIERTTVNEGIKNNNANTSSDVQSDAKFRTSSITGNIDEKDNTTEKPRNTRNTADDSKKDNHTASTANFSSNLPTVETNSENSKTSTIIDKTTEKQRNAEQSKDDDEDHNIPENSNVSTSTIKAYSYESNSNNGKGFQTTEKHRLKRDTSTMTDERQEQTEKLEKKGPSTISPSSLRRIGDPQDKFSETGTPQNEEDFRKISTTQTPLSARDTEVKNIDTTAKLKLDNFNTKSKTEELTDSKLRSYSQSSTENINDGKKMSTTQAPRNVRDTEVKNIGRTTAKPKVENFNTNINLEDQSEAKLHSLPSSTENNNDTKKIDTTQAPKSVRSTELKNIEHTVKPTLQDSTLNSEPKVQTGVPFRSLSPPTIENIAGKENNSEKPRIGRDTATESKNNDHTGKVNTDFRGMETISNLEKSPSPIDTTEKLKNADKIPKSDAPRRFESVPSKLTGEDHRILPTTNSGEKSYTTPKPRNTRDTSYYSSDTYHVPIHRTKESTVTTARATILLETELDMPMDYKQ